MCVRCVLIQAFFIAARFVRAMDRRLPNVLVAQKCLVAIRVVVMDIQDIRVVGIGRVVEVIYKVQNVRQRIRSELKI